MNLRNPLAKASFVEQKLSFAALKEVGDREKAVLTYTMPQQRTERGGRVPIPYGMVGVLIEPVTSAINAAL